MKLNHATSTTINQPLNAKVGDLINVLDQVQIDNGKKYFEVNEPTKALEIFDTLGLKFGFKSGELESANRRAEALLWPTSLEKSGVPSNKSADYLLKLSAIYKALSNPGKRSKLEELARKAPPQIVRLNEETLPIVDRLNEKIEIIKKDGIAPKLEPGLQNNSTPAAEGAGNAPSTKVKAGILRRFARTTLVSGVILLGGMKAFKTFEQPLANASLDSPLIRDVFKITQPIQGPLNKLSETAWDRFDKLEKTLVRARNWFKDKLSK